MNWAKTSERAWFASRSCSAGGSPRRRESLRAAASYFKGGEAKLKISILAKKNAHVSDEAPLMRTSVLDTLLDTDPMLARFEKAWGKRDENRDRDALSVGRVGEKGERKVDADARDHEESRAAFERQRGLR